MHTQESRSPMQSAEETVENASILSSGSSQDRHRLWIGNIDPKITEYHLVKLLEKFGKVKQFDFLFHKSGPLEGQPRGYCFVNFQTKEVLHSILLNVNEKRYVPDASSLIAVVGFRSEFVNGAW